MKQFIIIGLLLLSSYSCKQSNEKAISTDYTEEAVAESMPASTVDASSKNIADAVANSGQQQITVVVDTTIERKLIKEANLNWETSNIDKTHQSILQLSKKYGGYIADDNQTKDDYTINAYLTVKVPANYFDNYINDLQSDVKHFDTKNIKVLDVTEEYVDVAARIKTKQELEQRYLAILQKANSVEDILNVESQLNNVRTDIESAQARMKVLNHQIGYSTLIINFYETTSAPVGFFGEIGKSFVEGWKNILYFIIGIIKLWPFVIVILGVVYWIRKRRIRNR